MGARAGGIIAAAVALLAVAAPAHATGRDGTIARLADGDRRAAVPGCGGVVVANPTVVLGRQVRVEYNPADLHPSLNVSDYVEALDAAWEREISVFGWAQPPVRALDGRYPVMISDALPDGEFGFVTNEGDPALVGQVGDNSRTPWPERDASATCMVLNADFHQFRGDAFGSMRATVAHELLHALQFGIGALEGPGTPDLAMIEATAVYMEDEVFDDADDAHWYPYPDFGDDLGQHSEAGPEPYAAWLLVRGMLERFGTTTANGGQAVVRSVFEQISREEKGFLGALEVALAARGAGDLGSVYHEGSVGLRFQASCGSALAPPFCFEEAPDYLAIPSRNGSLPATHAAVTLPGAAHGTLPDGYATHFIGLPAGKWATLSVQSRGPAPGPLRATAACRIGGDQRRLELGLIGPGEARAVNFALDGCDTPTVVVSSAGRQGDDPAYAAAVPYRVAVLGDGPLTYPLTVHFDGPGARSGGVRADVSGLGCRATCTLEFPAGTLVELATDGTAEFAGWAGACSGRPTCRVEMSGARSVSAMFAPPRFNADRTAPRLSLPRKLRLQGRTVPVRLRCPQTERNGCEGVLRLRLGARTVARRAFTHKARGQAFTVSLPLSKATRRRLRSRRSVAGTLSLEVNDARGNARVQRRPIRLTR